ncbi:MAG: RNA polymerase sigma factor region1.1 domain-containing protein, partial [Phycisphaerales bacterium]
MIGILHPAVTQLIEAGQERGWLSFEELNNIIPDEYVEVVPLHALVTKLDELGIELVDEMEFRGRLFRAQRSGKMSLGDSIGLLTDQFRAMSVAGGEHLGDAEKVRIQVNASHYANGTGMMDAKQIAEAEKDVAEARAMDDQSVQRELDEAVANEASAKRMDDPVRMYLTQMGSIPLLT